MQLCWLWRWLGAKECREHSPGRNRMETKPPSWDSAENSPVDTLTSAQLNWLQTFDFQNHKGIHLCYFKPLSLWLFVTTAIQYKGEANTEGKRVGCKYFYSFEFFGLLFIERCRKSFCWVTFYVKDDFHINKGIILSCLNDAGISVKKSTLTYLN